MSYLLTSDVQSWLEVTKYNIDTVDRTFETEATQVVVGKLSLRYDTTSWVDRASSPELVVSLMGMLVASYELRKRASEEDGLVTHADWLEGRVMKLIESILEGSLDLQGATEDTSTALGGSAGFWPTDDSTNLAEEDPYAEGATPRAFSMNMRF